MSPDQSVDLYLPHPLDLVPLWALYLLSVVVLLLAIEGGYRLSKYMQRRSPSFTPEQPALTVPPNAPQAFHLPANTVERSMMS